MDTVLTIHLVSTCFMAGLIVFVQVVHYPLMAHVGAAGFTAYERIHTVRTGWVVIPTMTVELASAAWLAAAWPGADSSRLAWTGLALLALIWASTAFVQAPAHGALVRGFDERVHARLVTTNWVRTALWLSRIPVAVGLLIAGSAAC